MSRFLIVGVSLVRFQSFGIYHLSTERIRPSKLCGEFHERDVRDMVRPTWICRFKCLQQFKHLSTKKLNFLQVCSICFELVQALLIMVKAFPWEDAIELTAKQVCHSNFVGTKVALFINEHANFTLRGTFALHTLKKPSQIFFFT